MSNQNAPLALWLRLLLAALAAVVFVLLGLYWAMPAKSITVTTTYGKSEQRVSSTREVEDQRSDAVVLGLLGLGAVLGVTAISGGRLSLTGPGGVGLQAAAAIGAAGQAIGVASVQAADDPAVKAAIARWEGKLDALK